MIRALALALALIFASPAVAIDPADMLPDPSLEARAQALENALRCVQCQSESLASSNADWARDARLLVRQLISDGATDDDVFDFFVERYGEVVLMKPRAEGANLALWGTAPVLFILALGIAIIFLRRSGRGATAPLTEEEKARIDKLLDR
ncbi:MAG: cytochrome c-type biogenesis protein [Pseudomonadota bacterium]